MSPQLASEFISDCGVRLYFDSLIVKPAGAVGSGWHKDMTNSPFAAGKGAAARFLTLWIPLGPVPLAAGALRFAAGSHKEWRLTEGDHRTAALQQLIDRSATMSPVISPRAAAGDASVHSGQTLHSVLPNTGMTDRAVMTIIFVAESAPVLNAP